VAEAIERHRRGLDRNAKLYLDELEGVAEQRVREAAAAYLDASPAEFALTGNTTTGLALLYGGLRLHAGQEIVTTTHDFYSTHEALRLRALRTGAHVRRVTLYRNARTASVDEILSAVRRAIRPATRVLAVTWVHSGTGVKLPIAEIAEVLRRVNANRERPRRVLLCVDGVHGFGIEATTPSQLGCDFLVSGCHKWLFGPRGTGLIWGRRESWDAVTPIVPTFDSRAFGPWVRGDPSATNAGLPRSAAMSPGGFHAFEHRWALSEAFDFRRQIGRQRAAARTHELANRLKNGLATIRGVRLVTPTATRLPSPKTSGTGCSLAWPPGPASSARWSALLASRPWVVASRSRLARWSASPPERRRPGPRPAAARRHARPWLTSPGSSTAPGPSRRSGAGIRAPAARRSAA